MALLSWETFREHGNPCLIGSAFAKAVLLGVVVRMDRRPPDWELGEGLAPEIDGRVGLWACGPRALHRNLPKEVLITAWPPGAPS